MSRISGDARYPVRTLFPHCFPIPFAFTTGASGAETLLNNYNGAISLARATDTYTLTIPASLEVLAVVVDTNQGETLTPTKTIDAAAGTVALAFGTDFDSGRVDGVIWVTEHP